MSDELDWELRAVAHWIEASSPAVTVDEVMPVTPVALPGARRGHGSLQLDWWPRPPSEE